MSAGLLEGTSALVVGGASGIGRAVVERFLEEGALVSVLDVDPAPLEELDAEWSERLTVVGGDAVNGQAHAQAVATAVGRFGRLDTLVCCAGRFDFHTPIGTLTGQDLSRAFDEIFAVNVKSPLLAVHAASAELRRSQGSVVLTISGSAYHPEGGGVLYGASKWATRGIVTHLAREMAPLVRVNGVAPGGTAGTRLSGLAAIGDHRSVEEVPGRLARLASGNLLGVPAMPEDHAGAYVFLAAPRLSSFVNAAVVNSDGGRGERLEGPRTAEPPLAAGVLAGSPDFAGSPELAGSPEAPGSVEATELPDPPATGTARPALAPPSRAGATGRSGGTRAQAHARTSREGTR